MKNPGQLPRGRHGIPREIVVRSQQERLLAAIVEVSTDKGYEATSVADVLVASGVGRETFYELFDDKQQCFLLAHRALFEELFDAVADVYAQPGPWRERVANGLAELLDRLAADPGSARFLLIEIGKVGPASRELFSSTFTRVATLLSEGADPGGLPNAATIAGSAVFARIHEEIVLDRAAELPRLLPRLTYEALLPFIGEEEAREEEERLNRSARL